MSDLAFFAQRTTGWATSVWATSEKGNYKNERMSVSDPGEKIEWGAKSEPRKNERVPSSGLICVLVCKLFLVSTLWPWLSGGGEGVAAR